MPAHGAQRTNHYVTAASAGQWLKDCLSIRVRPFPAMVHITNSAIAPTELTPNLGWDNVATAYGYQV